jgi:D-alanyl-D-alanine carboxypeptidase
VKKIVIGFILLLLLFISGFIFVSLQNPESELLSPFTRVPEPDLVPQLSSRVHKLPDLDYTNATIVATLHPRIDYLVFSPQSFKVYAAKDQNVATSPASFTKLLTAQVALDLLPSSQLVQATATSVDRVPTILGLKVDESLTVEELVRASVATSANDAASTLGEGVAKYYSQKPEFFYKLMNQKATLIGMTNSNFKTADGLDSENQYATLADIAKLVYNALSYPEIVSAGKSDRDDLLVNANHGKYYLPNWNGLLGVYPGVTGLKIAYTGDAGYSTIVISQRQGKTVVVILNGADSILERDLAAGNLLDLAFIKEKISPANITKEQLRRHYAQWADLARQIREEIEALEEKIEQ